MKSLTGVCEIIAKRALYVLTGFASWTSQHFLVVIILVIQRFLTPLPLTVDLEPAALV